jgi:hypothetical protein
MIPEPTKAFESLVASFALMVRVGNFARNFQRIRLVCGDAGKSEGVPGGLDVVVAILFIQ